jgi:hypothetical protein
MPLEIILANNDRGYVTRQLYPTPNEAIGGYTFEIRGHTPAPTPTDGYYVAASVDVESTHGAAITRMVIEPSAFIQEGDLRRPRTDAEKHLSPVNSSVLGLIKFTDIINRLAEVEEEYADRVKEIPGMETAANERLENLRRRGPRRNDAQYARHAEQALDAMSKGRGYQRRLKQLYPADWYINDESLKQRIRRLRENEWLAPPRYPLPGIALIEWRNEHGHDHWQKETE